MSSAWLQSTTLSATSQWSNDCEVLDLLNSVCKEWSQLTTTASEKFIRRSRAHTCYSRHVETREAQGVNQREYKRSTLKGRQSIRIAPDSLPTSHMSIICKVTAILACCLMSTNSTSSKSSVDGLHLGAKTLRVKIRTTSTLCTFICDKLWITRVSSWTLTHRIRARSFCCSYSAIIVMFFHCHTVDDALVLGR